MQTEQDKLPPRATPDGAPREPQALVHDVVKLWDDLAHAQATLNAVEAYIRDVHGPIYTSAAFEELLVGTPWQQPEGYDTPGLYGRMRDAIQVAKQAETTLASMTQERDEANVDLLVVLARPGAARVANGFCEAHQPPHTSCACCEAVHENDERLAAEATLVRLDQERDDIEDRLNENDVPTTDALGTLSLAGRFQAYVNSVDARLEQGDVALASLQEENESLKRKAAVDDLAFSSANHLCVEAELALARLQATHEELLKACQSALDWHALDGDHITEPARSLLLTAVAHAEARP